MGTTARGVPFVDGTDLVSAYPAADEAQAEWVNDHPGTTPMTTVERNALAGAELWAGRTIYNTTTGTLETYDGSDWLGGWETYLAATLTAVTTNPSLGAGTAGGAYRVDNDLVVGSVGFTFGAGATPGSGEYRVSLPVDAHGTAYILGHGYVYDASAAIYRVASLGYVSATTARIINNGSAPVSDSVPWTWADGDLMRFSLQYRPL